MTGKLEGRTAIVTGAGASSQAWGTGRAMAQRFAREGAKLVLFDVNEEAVAKSERMIMDEGGHAVSVTGDVASDADVHRLMETALSRFGTIDILVNNVGIGGSASGLLNEREEDWDRVLAVNAKGAFLTAKRAVPHMLEHGKGHILNIASVAGMRVVAIPPPYGYSVSKAAVIQITRLIALEFAGRGLRCNCIVPGMLDSSNLRIGYAKAGFTPEAIEKELRRRDERSPTGRQGTPFDVAATALFLVSGEADFINGAEIVVDGGQIQATQI